LTRKPKMAKIELKKTKLMSKPKRIKLMRNSKRAKNRTQEYSDQILQRWRKMDGGGADISGCERISEDSVLAEAEEDVRVRREKL